MLLNTITNENLAWPGVRGDNYTKAKSVLLQLRERKPSLLTTHFFFSLLLIPLFCSPGGCLLKTGVQSADSAHGGKSANDTVQHHPQHAPIMSHMKLHSHQHKILIFAFGKFIFYTLFVYINMWPVWKGYWLIPSVIQTNDFSSPMCNYSVYVWLLTIHQWYQFACDTTVAPFIIIVIAL